MAETITIQLPENAHDREEVWQYRQDNRLTGLGSELSKARKEFREDFFGNS